MNITGLQTFTKLRQTYTEQPLSTMNPISRVYPLLRVTHASMLRPISRTTVQAPSLRFYGQSAYGEGENKPAKSDISRAKEHPGKILPLNRRVIFSNMKRTPTPQHPIALRPPIRSRIPAILLRDFARSTQRPREGRDVQHSAHTVEQGASDYH